MSLKSPWIAAALLVGCGGPTPVRLPTEAGDRSAIVDIGEQLLAIALDDGEFVGGPLVIDIGDPATARVHFYRRTLDEIGLIEGAVDHRDDLRGRPFPTPARTTELTGEAWVPTGRFTGAIADATLPDPPVCRTFTRLRTSTFDGSPRWLVAMGEPDEWEERFVVFGLTGRKFYFANRDETLPVVPPEIDPSICSTCEVVGAFRGFANAFLFSYDDANNNDFDGAVWQTTLTLSPPTWALPQRIATPTRDFGVKRIAAPLRRPVTSFAVLAYEFQEDGFYDGLVDRLTPGDAPEAVLSFTQGATVALARAGLSTDADHVAALWPFGPELFDTRYSQQEPVVAPNATALLDMPSIGLVVGDRSGGLHRVVDGELKQVVVGTGDAIEDLMRYDGGFVALDRRGNLRQYLVDDDMISPCSGVMSLNAIDDLHVVRVLDDIVVLSRTGNIATLDWWSAE